jgi:translation initiation factor 2D
MAVPSVEVTSTRKKGKAVLLIHTWKDHLWDMGSKPEVPEDTILTTPNGEVDDPNSESQVLTVGEQQASVEGPSISPVAEPTPFCASGSSERLKPVTYTPQEVTELLNMTLIQAISENLSSLPSSTFPMPATFRTD